MKIGIDARLIMETGVGRYIRNLIKELGRIDSHNSYVIFLPKKAFDTFELPNTRWKKVCADVHWHTVREQIVMPRLFYSERLDLLHVPYHNPPIGYRGAMVITIHDLTILHFPTGKATTLPYVLYRLKRLGYWIELWIGLWKASKVIAVSKATKREIMDHFHIPESRICVTYEGVDTHLTSVPRREMPLISNPYVLYVGNAYPHKNIETLIHAFSQLKGVYTKNDWKLVLVGGKDYFYRRIQTLVNELHLSSSVICFGLADDRQLANLYTFANVFAFPSRMEGFGLPALEALSFGCPVLASDIPIFHEILDGKATYVNTMNSKALADAMMPYLKHSVIKSRAPITTPTHFSWSDMAQKTLLSYENSVRV